MAKSLHDFGLQGRRGFNYAAGFSFVFGHAEAAVELVNGFHCCFAAYVKPLAFEPVFNYPHTGKCHHAGRDVAGDFAVGPVADGRYCHQIRVFELAEGIFNRAAVCDAWNNLLYRFVYADVRTPAAIGFLDPPFF
jgi:hypothetical protein